MPGFSVIVIMTSLMYIISYITLLITLKAKLCLKMTNEMYVIPLFYTTFLIALAEHVFSALLSNFWGLKYRPWSSRNKIQQSKSKSVLLSITLRRNSNFAFIFHFRGAAPQGESTKLLKRKVSLHWMLMNFKALCKAEGVSLCTCLTLNSLHLCLALCEIISKINILSTSPYACKEQVAYLVD